MTGWIRCLLVGMVTGLCGAMLGLTPMGTEFEQDLGLTWLFDRRGPREAPPEVVVVGVNADTGRDLGLARMPREWPRTIHAELIQRLSQAGAAVIVFDMDFNRAKDPQDDRIFADAIRSAGRVVLFERLDAKRQPVISGSGERSGWYWVEQRFPPLEILAGAARAVAPFPLPKLEEALFQFWAFKASAKDAPTLPAVALQLHTEALYPRLLNLLAAAGAPAAGSPGPDTQLPTDAEALRLAMADLRGLIGGDPALAERMRGLLAATAGGVADRNTRLLRSLVDLYGGGNSYFLNFYGPPGSVTTIPYQRLVSGIPYELLIRGELPEAGPDLPDLQGKVVFVGYSDIYDPGQPDRFFTVFTGEDGVDLSGVEIAATAFANLLTGSSVKPVSNFTTALALFLFGALVAGAVYRYPPLYAIPAVLLAAAGYAMAAQQAFNEWARWYPLAIPILVQLPLALFVGLLAQYVLERRHKQRVSQAVAYYLPAGVAERLVREGVEDEALNRVSYATCLATDMQGFTTLSESMPPRELAAFMNDYFEALASPLRAHGVDVTEFRADAIMCAWTGEQSDAAVRGKAADAALGAVEAIDEFNARRASEPLKLRIGLAEGNVYVGHAGGGGRFVYSIVGDAANTAARVESLNKQLGTTVLVTDGVARELSDKLLRPLGRFVFVGKTEALGVSELLADRGAASPAQLRLCKRFSRALDRFHHRDWPGAQEGFAEVLEEFPEDGPSRFLLGLCLRYRSEPPPPDDYGVIRLSAK